jgi:phosphotransferase system IIB component
MDVATHCWTRVRVMVDLEDEVEATAISFVYQSLVYQ